MDNSPTVSEVLDRAREPSTQLLYLYKYSVLPRHACIISRCILSSHMISDFHVNQPLILLTLFPNPSSDVEHMLHSLDVRRALAFYISRTEEFHTSRLFVCFYGSQKGSPGSSQTVSRWIVSAITLAYDLAGKTLPEVLKAHSTRVLATSTALLRGVEVPDICRAATWSTPSTFVTQYHLDVRAKKEASFGRAVLTSLLA